MAVDILAILEAFADCHEIFKTGTQFFDAVVNNEYSVSDIETCSQNCAREPNCKTFAYRYVFVFRIFNFFLKIHCILILSYFIFYRVDTYYVSSSTSNCQLTALHVEDILSTDLNSNNAWNVYEKKDCGGGGGLGIFLKCFI